jgi:DUF1680 family protein
VLLNGILAALPPQPDGRTFYYSDYRPGARKQYFGDVWPCCSGTYAQITADYPLDIYFHDGNTLYVNLFSPSQVRWERGGHMVTVEQNTEFPESNLTTLTIRSQHRERFALSVRVPLWATDGVLLRLNGKTTNVKASHGTFLNIARTWHDGDVVSITFPMSLRFEPIDAQTPNSAALMYGPLLLVALADGPVRLEEDPRTPVAWIAPRTNERLAFQTRDGRVVFCPFYLVRDRSYTTYCQFGSSTDKQHL